MSEIRRAVVKSYDAAAHKAAVQIAGSLAVWLDDVRVATNIPPADVVAGRQCTVLFLDPSNQDDAVIISVQGALPSVGEILVATATANLTLTTTAQSITGDGDSSKVRLLLPTPGDWLVTADVDFIIDVDTPGTLKGELFVDDSGSGESGLVLFKSVATQGGTKPQHWKVTTTAADTPIELKAYKDSAGGTARALATHTRLTATGVKRSTAGGGVTDHDLLSNLGFSVAGHTGFVASGGVAGGQTIQGGTAASENLTLESTAHATKGYIAAKDPIRMTNATAANTRIADSFGVNYVELGALTGLRIVSALGSGITLVSPTTVSGALRADGNIGVQVPATTNTLIDASPAKGTQSGAWQVLNAGLQLTAGANATQLVGLLATPMLVNPNGKTGIAVRGQEFQLSIGAGVLTSTVTICDTIYTRLGIAAYDGSIDPFHGFHLDAVFATSPGANQTIPNYFGMKLSAPNYNKVVNYTGLAIPDETLATGNIHLVEIGPATPYLRVVGGAAPGAQLTNVWVDIGTVGLRQIQVGAANSGGAGFRQVIVAN